MKRLIFSIITSLSLLGSINAKIITVTVANFSFSGQNIVATVGDTIKWQWVSGTHTTTSTAVPAGASSWNANITSSSPTFIYKITVAGSYNYNCSIHPTMMTGTITASNPASGIPIVNDNSLHFSAYPNPFSKNLALDFNTTDLSSSNSEIQVIDILGKICFHTKSAEALINNGKVTLDLEFLNEGIYFIYLSDGQKRSAIKVVKTKKT